MNSPARVAVVGGGIIGVSSALRALETTPGIQLTLIAEKFSPDTTGDGAAGFWHPFLYGDVSPAVLKFWCEKSFEFLLNIQKSAEASDYGVGLLSAYYVSQTPLEKPLYSDTFLGYRNMDDKELALFPLRYRYGVFFTTLYAECAKMIPMMMKRIQRKGGKIIQRKLNSIDELAGEYDIVINCPGLGAYNLVSDLNVTPIRGQVMRVRAPWVKHAVIGGDDYHVLPNTDEVVCGGTHQVGNWSRDANEVDRDAIWRGCISLVPSLKKAEILREWVGLRPGRTKLRIERETMRTTKGKLEVIHNYGHGGSGVTLFWGCAIHATNLLQEALSGAPISAKL